MKRDMDLIRTILLALEQHPGGFAPGEIALENATPEAIGYHVHLLGQAGLVKIVDVTVLADASPQAKALSLTWQGHEFLDDCRNLDRWQRAKQLLGRVGTASLPIWQRVLADLVRQSLGL